MLDRYLSRMLNRHGNLLVPFSSSPDTQSFHRRIRNPQKASRRNTSVLACGTANKTKKEITWKKEEFQQNQQLLLSLSCVGIFILKILY